MHKTDVNSQVLQLFIADVNFFLKEIKPKAVNSY